MSPAWGSFVGKHSAGEGNLVPSEPRGATAHPASAGLSTLSGSGLIPTIPALFIHQLHFLGASAAASKNKKPMAHFHAIKAQR